MRLTLTNLKELISGWVNTSGVAVTDFNVTRNNIIGLVDKIGKIFTIPQTFYDKLPELDGEFLSYGKTVEEYHTDLINPVESSAQNNNMNDYGKALAPYFAPQRPVYYSYTTGRRFIPLSIPNNNIERAVHNTGEFVTAVNSLTKSMYDSRSVYRYGLKRRLIGLLGDKMTTELDSSATAFTASMALTNGQLIYAEDSVTSAKNYYVAVKEGNADSTIEASVTSGKVVKLDLSTALAIPTDSATGEAFIKSVKTYVEKANDISEGNSLSGATLGAEEGLTLYIKQGIIPSLEVDTIAGAFQKEELAIPCTVKVIKDFGKQTNSNVYAVLVDNRAIRLHPTYSAVRENVNGYGDFLNLFNHMEDTAFISLNCFAHVWETA